MGESRGNIRWNGCIVFTLQPAVRELGKNYIAINQCLTTVVMLLQNPRSASVSEGKLTLAGPIVFLHTLHAPAEGRGGATLLALAPN